MKTRRIIAAALTAGLALAIVGIAGVAPANAGGLDGSAVTISNFSFTVGNDGSGRKAHMTFDMTSADPNDPGEFEYRIFDYSICSQPSEFHDQFTATTGQSVDHVDLSIPVDPDGYLRLEADYSNGDGTGGTIDLPTAFAYETPVSSGDFVATIFPTSPETDGTGDIGLNAGGEEPTAHYELFLNGVASGGVRDIPGCSVFSFAYSDYAPGTVVTLRFLDADTEALNYTVPGGTPPRDNTGDGSSSGGSSSHHTSASSHSDPVAHSLAHTGADTSIPTLAAGALLLLGALFLSLGFLRRRAVR